MIVETNRVNVTHACYNYVDLALCGASVDCVKKLIRTSDKYNYRRFAYVLESQICICSATLHC